MLNHVKLIYEYCFNYRNCRITICHKFKYYKSIYICTLSNLLYLTTILFVCIICLHKDVYTGYISEYICIFIYLKPII